MIANIITVSRILFSLCLFAISPSSPPFAVLYLLCGITDVLDGFLARKLHTQSKAGEKLDSIADLFFAAVYAVKVLPGLYLPVWVLIWTAIIALIKFFGILKGIKQKQGLYIAHSFLNKLTGFLIFVLPMAVYFIEIKYSAAAVCAVATFAAIEELFANRKAVP